MDTQSSSTRALKPAQEQEVAEDRRRPTGTRLTYLHCFRLQVLLPMDTQSSSTRALKPAQEQEVAEDRRRPTKVERDTELDVWQKLGDEDVTE